MTQEEAAARAHAKASICTPALPWKAEFGIIPFLMVSAVLAPTVMAPSSSKMVARTMAHLYEMDLEDTLVAHEFATSSGRVLETDQDSDQDDKGYTY